MAHNSPPVDRESRKGRLPANPKVAVESEDTEDTLSLSSPLHCPVTPGPVHYDITDSLATTAVFGFLLCNQSSLVQSVITCYD